MTRKFALPAVFAAALILTACGEENSADMEAANADSIAPVETQAQAIFKDSNENCEPGYTGVNCRECAEGYYKNGNQCVACTPIRNCWGQITCTEATDSICSECLNSRRFTGDQCSCKAGHYGDDCELCAEGYNPSYELTSWWPPFISASDSCVSSSNPSASEIYIAYHEYLDCYEQYKDDEQGWRNCKTSILKLIISHSSNAYTTGVAECRDTFNRFIVANSPEDLVDAVRASKRIGSDTARAAVRAHQLYACAEEHQCALNSDSFDSDCIVQNCATERDECNRCTTGWAGDNCDLCDVDEGFVDASVYNAHFRDSTDTFDLKITPACKPASSSDELTSYKDF